MVLAVFGVLLVILGLLAAGHSFLLWLERQAHGAGLFFAGVEIFGVLAILSLTAGAVAMIGARALLRGRAPHEAVPEKADQSAGSSLHES